MNARQAVRAAFVASAVAIAAGELLAQADRSAPPKPGPVRPLVLPGVERLSLSNDLPVLLVPMHEALTDLLQARDEPGRIASRALAEAVFGRGHRYGRPRTGDAASIASFTVAELRAFVVGDRSKVEAPLAGLGLGPVRTLAVEDVMGPAPKVE